MVIFLPDGRILTDYTEADIAEAVGAQVHPKRQAYDLVVAGAGRAERRGLWRIGGAVHAGVGEPGDGRAGGHQLPDP